MAMKVDDLKKLLTSEMKDLYSAERQLVEALPKMAKNASSPQLKQAFENHLRVTQKQAQRIEKMFDYLEGSPSGKRCVGMEGLIKEGEEILKEVSDPETRDAGLIGAAQKVEHYEIASYGTARAHAEVLGYREVASLIQQTLDEEGETNKVLTQLAESGINQQARQ